MTACTSLFLTVSYPKWILSSTCYVWKIQLFDKKCHTFSLFNDMYHTISNVMNYHAGNVQFRKRSLLNRNRLCIRVFRRYSAIPQKHSFQQRCWWQRFWRETFLKDLSPTFITNMNSTISKKKLYVNFMICFCGPSW